MTISPPVWPNYDLNADCAFPGIYLIPKGSSTIKVVLCTDPSFDKQSSWCGLVGLTMPEIKLMRRNRLYHCRSQTLIERDDCKPISIDMLALRNWSVQWLYCMPRLLHWEFLLQKRAVPIVTKITLHTSLHLSALTE